MTLRDFLNSKVTSGELESVVDNGDNTYTVTIDGYEAIVDANGKKLYAEVAKRLIPCIWNGSKVPVDYVNRAVQKASTPLAYKERKNWERVLTLACSFVKKNRKEKYKEEWK